MLLLFSKSFRNQNITRCHGNVIHKYNYCSRSHPVWWCHRSLSFNISSCESTWTDRHVLLWAGKDRRWVRSCAQDLCGSDDVYYVTLLFLESLLKFKWCQSFGWKAPFCSNPPPGSSVFSLRFCFMSVGQQEKCFCVFILYNIDIEWGPKV